MNEWLKKYTGSLISGLGRFQRLTLNFFEFSDILKGNHYERIQFIDFMLKKIHIRRLTLRWNMH